MTVGLNSNLEAASKIVWRMLSHVHLGKEISLWLTYKLIRGLTEVKVFFYLLFWLHDTQEPVISVVPAPNSKILVGVPSLSLDQLSIKNAK